MTVDDPLAVADEIASLTRPLLVVFDCDGVLAPIVEHPDDSRLLDGTSRLLTDLAAPDDVSVAILSGRSVAGLDQFDFDPAIDVVGSYGNERRGDDGPALTRGERELLQRLVVLAEEGAAAAGDGAHVEHKPASVVLHVRPADPERGASALASTRTRAE
ncbi:MAG: trehalose-phosphatase, partial [Actinomycetota bacterium]